MKLSRDAVRAVRTLTLIRIVRRWMPCRCFAERCVDVVGSGFRVNNQIVPYGVLQPTAGLLDCELENSISSETVLLFEHNQPGTSNEGLVILVPGSRDPDADMLDNFHESVWNGDPNVADGDRLEARGPFSARDRSPNPIRSTSGFATHRARC